MRRRDSIRASRAALRGGSKSFHAASLLLPRRVRHPATVLYAFCRDADDAVDLGTDAKAALAALRRRLDLIEAGRPEPPDAPLADVVARFSIPRAHFDALIEGFTWDAERRRYETLEELSAYGARVAGAVGAMMALAMETRAPEALARACELGIAMQFTNIARDVGEDARAGRLYLPQSWLREAGLDPDGWLSKPAFDPRLASVVARLLAAAEALYVEADAGIAELPRDCRPGIRAARLLYAEIGAEVARRDCDSVSVRARVSAWRKAALLAAAVLPDLTPSASGAAHGAPATSLAGRLVWLIALFERLERSDIARGAGGAGEWARVPTR